jgi:hypothetical protein
MMHNKKSVQINDGANDYEIGYANPPKETQFQKGQSGNPKGRPKGRRNIATALQSALNEKVTITENGRRKQITKLEATMKQVVNKAASGEASATKVLLQLFPFLESELAETPQTSTPEADKQVLASLVNRWQQQHAPHSSSQHASQSSTSTTHDKGASK